MLYSVRIVGVLVAVLFAYYGISKYRNGQWTRFDLTLALLVSAGVATVSIFPPVGNILMSAFGLKNRLFAILVFTNLLLFGLFFYALNQIRSINMRNIDTIRALAKQKYMEEFGFANRETGNAASGNQGKILVTIPAYNEEVAIQTVLPRIPSELLGYRLDTLVIVDGATDRTEEVSRKAGVSVATHIINCGGGAAHKTGFDIAKMIGADIVVNMDADGQHRPEEIERLVTPIINNQADFVWGSRFYGYYEERGSIRHAGVVFFSRMISILIGFKVTDCTNGFRAIRVRDLEKLHLKEEQFHTTEMIIEAAKKGLRLMEVPISVLKRAEGESKKPKRLRYPLGVLRVIVQTWLR
ncbi:glycosyl transferase family 2 [Thermobaculum terrenum ATCC BAA-798]|uniref:Glycosyl transferase family 2 n=1 Tax=Thermobaculum terrenum (strain ATCC BAA-798 / CCMEE 7001 / YNP1) TaxID=525904 RepID=D1CDY6_THET1|nr:DUF2304 family protein [Thermobaculum terrenum]ACZ41142.1 glycosyl transferase family 2 [Thermobaculum terrenum ATCC BAA-798]